jgi:Ku70/Ku80 beta-barrel domain
MSFLIQCEPVYWPLIAGCPRCQVPTRQHLVDEVTREVVEDDNKGRGYEYAKNAYIPVDDDEFDAIAVDSTHTINIDPFVPRKEIDERYLDTPYYITPDGDVGQEAFAVIREAMRGKDMVALGRVVLSKRERVIMLEAWDKGLIGTTLRYPYEIREAKEYFDDVPDLKVAPDMLKLADHILKSKATDFDPSQPAGVCESASGVPRCRSPPWLLTSCYLLRRSQSPRYSDADDTRAVRLRWYPSRIGANVYCAESYRTIAPPSSLCLDAVRLHMHDEGESR